MLDEKRLMKIQEIGFAVGSESTYLKNVSNRIYLSNLIKYKSFMKFKTILTQIAIETNIMLPYELFTKDEDVLVDAAMIFLIGVQNAIDKEDNINTNYDM